MYNLLLYFLRPEKNKRHCLCLTDHLHLTATPQICSNKRLPQLWFSLSRSPFSRRTGLNFHVVHRTDDFSRLNESENHGPLQSKADGRGGPREDGGAGVAGAPNPEVRSPGAGAGGRESACVSV